MLIPDKKVKQYIQMLRIAELMLNESKNELTAAEIRHIIDELAEMMGNQN